MYQPMAVALKLQGLLDMAVVCAPGLEPVTRDELTALSWPGVTVNAAKGEPGVVLLRGELEALYGLNLHLRTASRLLVRLGEFPAAAFSELRKKASRLPWPKVLEPGRPINLRVTTHASALYHKKGIAERVAGAVEDALGKASPIVPGDDEGAAEAQMIVVRLVRNLCLISVDSSGEHLHRRGYRLESAKAPLRETLAASVILASGWPGTAPLVDPFCGAGTIPIEAAMMAAGIPPGLNRRFAFETWPGFDGGVWKNQIDRARAGIRPVAVELVGSDRDAGAIKAAQANAERAGVAAYCTWERRSISDLMLPETPGWMVTNPPYGERVKGGPDLRNLYARTGSVWRTKAPLWHIHFITSSPKWAGQIGMPVSVKARFLNGGIPVSLFNVEG